MNVYQFWFLAFFLGSHIFSGSAAFSQTISPSSVRDVKAEAKASDAPFAEERAATGRFIENINEARKDLTMRQADLAQQKILMARNLLPLIARAAPAQRRITRVEFGGGIYANDLDQRKSYMPIETQSLEDLTRRSGPRWVQNTRTEADAKIIYIVLDLTDNKAQTYLNEAEKYIAAGTIKEAEIQLAELSDKVIHVDDAVPLAIQARDYLILADNYITVANFYGAQNSLDKSGELLAKMKDAETYKPYYWDIITLQQSIRAMQEAFVKLDAAQIKTAGDSFKKWQQQLSVWAGE